MKTKVLVIGTGVSGLTTALKLLINGYNVTLWSKEGRRDIPRTSANAYAMWTPVAIESEPRIERWSFAGLEAFTGRAGIPNCGIALRPIFTLKTEKSEPWFAGKLKSFRHAKPDEISDEYTDAWVVENSPIIDPTRYMPWLLNQVICAGGKVEQRNVNSLDQMNFDVTVNCTSLASRELAADEEVYPCRMQTVTIKHNGFDRVVIDDEGPNARSCIVPHSDYIKLGAVFRDHDESTHPFEDDTRGILERCNKMVPGFNADRNDVISVRCAARPERSRIRVESIDLGDGRTLIHNYGHDGMGFITADGIADDIAKLIDNR